MYWLGIAAIIIAITCIIWDIAAERFENKKTEEYLKEVCTEQVSATVINYKDISYPIDEDLADLVGHMELNGLSMLVGTPKLKYKYNEKDYKTEYKCRKMQLLSNDNQWIAYNHINIWVNPNNPKEIYMGDKIDRLANEDFY